MQTITVYAGSSGFAPETHNSAARELGLACANKNTTLCYGGMNAGLMYLVAEACRRNDGNVIGVIPSKLKDSERVHRELDELITVETLWERKREMYYRADAIFALPGGFGTFDEVAEIIYWGVLGFHKKPMVLINIDGYWDDFIAYFENDVTVGVGERGSVKDFLVVANSIEEAFDKAESWNAPEYAGMQDDREEFLPHFEDAFCEEDLKCIIIDDSTAQGAYQIATALTLRQLGKHNLPIGVLNDHAEFNKLLKWIDDASAARYITAKCTDLFAVASNKIELSEKLDALAAHDIDLHEDKWGDKPDYQSLYTGDLALSCSGALVSRIGCC